MFIYCNTCYCCYYNSLQFATSLDTGVNNDDWLTALLKEYEQEPEQEQATTENVEKLINFLKLKKMKILKQIDPNKKTSLEDIKEVLKDSKIENGTLILNPEHFKGFKWLLTKVVNVFSNSTIEARKYFNNFVEKNDIKKAKFEYIPEWAK